MRLRFGTTDFHAYADTRGTLLDELDDWLSPREESERVEVLGDVKQFLDWRYRESVGALDKFALTDISEFLLEWCPVRLKSCSDAAINVCFAVGLYFEFMAATGRLVGGSDRAVRLRRLVDALVPTVLAEVRDPTTAAGSLGSVGAAEPYVLPFHYSPPAATDVRAVASAVPLLSKLDALRGYLGSDGMQLTDSGHLRMSDGRALVTLARTGDVLDFEIGGRKIQTASTAAFRRLNFILDCAIEVGAVLVRQHRVVRAQAWETRTAVERAEALFSAIRELRPLQTLDFDLDFENKALSKLLDDGIVHWLIPMLAREDCEVAFETLLEYVQKVVDEQVRPLWRDENYMIEDSTEQGLGRLFEVLADAGVVRWTDRKEVPQLIGVSQWTGGVLALTALGRKLLPDYLDQAGCVLRRVEPVANEEAAARISAMFGGR